MGQVSALELAPGSVAGSLLGLELEMEWDQELEPGSGLELVLEWAKVWEMELALGWELGWATVMAVGSLSAPEWVPVSGLGLAGALLLGQASEREWEPGLAVVWLLGRASEPALDLEWVPVLEPGLLWAMDLVPGSVPGLAEG